MKIILIRIQKILNLRQRSGAEAIRDILSLIDLRLEIANLQEEYRKTTSVAIRHKIMRRIKVFSGLLHGNMRPEWMIIDNFTSITTRFASICAVRRWSICKF